MICTEPENIRFDEKTPTRLQSGFLPLEPLRITEFDIHAIATLADEIRDAIANAERANAEAAPAATQKPEPRWKFHRSAFRFSNPVRN